MITCCTNQDCSAAHCHSAGGKMYSVEGQAGLEFFWLCPRCAPHYDLSLDSGKRVHLRPRPETGRMSLVQLPQIEDATHTCF